MKCRYCSNNLNHEFVDLINTPPSNSYLFQDELNEPETYFPLKVFVCENCFLVQVDEYKKSDEIFNKNYAYFSSYSRTWLEHSKKYTDYIIQRFGYNEQSLVIEIASNDGYLLQYFKEKNIQVLGVEPTESTAKVAEEKGIETIIEFFGESFAKKLQAKGKKANLLLGNNVLAHVPNINDFVKGLKIALKEDGVVTMEFPHLMQLVKYNQFDTIYHEHFSYLSLFVVKQIFQKAGMEIFDVEKLTTHGGSLRIFARHVEDSSKPIESRVSKLIEEEKSEGLDKLEYYKNFQFATNQVKYDFLNFLLENRNKKVIGYGAAAKGNTLLNFCGVKNDIIKFVVDASPHKQGKYLPGSHIPIVSEKDIRQLQPNYVVIFPWNIKEEIENQLSYIRDWKGKFVVVIPKLLIY